MAKNHTQESELCSACTMDQLFDRDVDLATHVATLMDLWSSAHRETMRTAFALLSATARVAEGWQEDHAEPEPVPHSTMKRVKDKVVAMARR